LVSSHPDSDRMISMIKIEIIGEINFEIDDLLIAFLPKVILKL